MAKRSREDSDPTPSIAVSSPSSALSSSPTFSRTPSLSPRPSSSAANEQAVKHQHLDPESASSNHIAMRCFLTGHAPSLPFSTYELYETHYKSAHTHRCAACALNFPTAHYLSLHQTEYHDPFTTLLRERGERVYACLVEGCDRKCSSKEKRRRHCIDKHCFPQDYDFRIIQTGLGQRTSMLQSGRGRRGSLQQKQRLGVDVRRRERAATLEKMSVPAPDVKEEGSEDDMSENPHQTPVKAEAVKFKKPDSEVDSLAGAMSALRFVPPSVRFGRKPGGTGFSRS